MGRWVTAGVAALALAGGTAEAAHAQDPVLTQPVLGGRAFDGFGATLASGTSTYVGVGGAQLKATGGGFIGTAPTGTGAVAPAGVIPAVDGSVLATAEDGAGGLYIGGSFTKVGSVARRNLAHIRVDGSVDPAFNPSPDGQVTALDLAGDKLAVVGTFTAAGGGSFAGEPAAARLAVLTAASGTATSFRLPANWTPERIDATGNKIYLTGLLFVGDTYRSIAALDLTSGAVLPWAPDPAVVAGDAPFDALKVVGSTVVAGVIRDYSTNAHELLGVDATTGAVRWREATAMNNPLLSKTSSRLYVVPNDFIGVVFTPDGVFPGVRPYALDPVTGKRVWEAKADLLGPDRVNNTASGATVSGTTLYLTGGFVTASGQDRFRTAAFDTTTGALTAWNPRLTSPGGAAVVAYRGRIVLGGAFRGAGASLATGLPDLGRYRADGTRDTSFAGVTLGNAFQPGGGPGSKSVGALLRDGNVLYVGGRFWKANGADRGANLAAFDATTGALLPRFGGGFLTNDYVAALRLVGSRLFVKRTTGGTDEYTRADGTKLAYADTYAAKLDAFADAISTPSATPVTASLVTPEAATVSVEATLTTGYVVGTGSATTTAAGQTATVTFELNDVGKLIRSVFPTYGFNYKSTSRFTADGFELSAYR